MYITNLFSCWPPFQPASETTCPPQHPILSWLDSAVMLLTGCCSQRTGCCHSCGLSSGLGKACPFLLFPPALQIVVSQEFGLSRVFYLLEDKVASSWACQACDLEGIIQRFLAQITFCESDYSGLLCMLVSIKKLHRFE